MISTRSLEALPPIEEYASMAVEEYASMILDPEGSEELLSLLEGRPELYVAWAADYFEKETAIEDVARVLALEPLDEDLVARLGSERSLAELRDDLEEIGYPTP